MAGNKHCTPPTSNRYLKRLKSVQAEALREMDMQLSRPMSSLDDKAKELGVYDKQFHCMPRRERKRLVSLAFSKQLHAVCGG